jgi:hypothetical protein
VEPRKPLHGDGHLPAAFTRMKRAIDALIEGAGQFTDTGKYAHIPSPYDQLYDAIPGSQGSGHEGLARSLPPLWLDATRLIGIIDAEVRKWQRHIPPSVPADFIGPLPFGWRRRQLNETPDTLPTVRRLIVIRERSYRPQDVKFLDDISDTIQGWIIDIEVLLTPETVHALWAAEGGGFAACPHCDAKMAKKRDNAGEIVGTPALQLRKDGSTHCQACKTTWGPEQAMWVCRMLGYPLPAGVLE